jgi:hypothetical protein
MSTSSRTAVYGAALVLLTAFTSAPASASFILQDTYYGGIDTWNYPSDVIGDPNTFNITSAVIGRTNNGNTLEITINTNYAGKPGTAAADGTGYGALFLTPGTTAWSPQGVGPGYYTDTYQPGDWMYAATIPLDPNSSSGAGGLYLTSGGSIVMSHVGNYYQTYPLDPASPWYFRAGQAVQFTPGAGESAAAGTNETWAIGNDAITFFINDNGLLGDDFALSWAMTCANDIIQGQVDLPPQTHVDVPEPSTWSILLAGLLFAAHRSWRRPRRASARSLASFRLRRVQATYPGLSS